MTTQMIAEAESPWDGGKKARPDLMIQAPQNEKIVDRGSNMFDESQQQPDSNGNKQLDDNNNNNVEIGDMLMPWEEDAVRSKAQAQTPQNQQMRRGAGEEKTSE